MALSTRVRRAILYEAFAMVLVFLLAFIWYGQWQRSLAFTVLTFVVLSGYYFAFHSVVE